MTTNAELPPVTEEELARWLFNRFDATSLSWDSAYGKTQHALRRADARALLSLLHTRGAAVTSPALTEAHELLNRVANLLHNLRTMRCDHFTAHRRTLATAIDELLPRLTQRAPEGGK